MKRGRKPSTGTFSNRKDLEEEIIRLRKKGYSFEWIGRYCKVNSISVAKIYRNGGLNGK